MNSVTIFIFLGQLRLKVIGINVEVGTVRYCRQNQGLYSLLFLVYF